LPILLQKILIVVGMPPPDAQLVQPVAFVADMGYLGTQIYRIYID
jgi:hypothetical protein